MENSKKCLYKKYRKHLFTVHNCGPYNSVLKQELLDNFRIVYGDKLISYLICQEEYPNEHKDGPDPNKVGDSHLQGCIFFSTQTALSTTLKGLSQFYQPVARIDVRPFIKELNMINYFKDTKKILLCF